ncbi:MAG: class I SAM-dependent methyltransferase [Deltaproteobacteria bacterium]|nr:MAG: class I SAM-dependent methyltransferase [Deltaproteobacteria bacterium]
MGDETHWEGVYQQRATDAVSWYRPHLEQSLAWIQEVAPSTQTHVVDAGGGASTLVDDLLALGFEALTVIDLSTTALQRSQERLADSAQKVDWIAGDVTQPLLEPDSVDLWHDRAVFHFLTEPSDRVHYARQVRAALRPGGHAIVATFAPDGPEKCSGLTVQRYTPQGIADALGAGFTLLQGTTEVHQTPWGSPQAFSYALLRRIAEA